MGLAGQPDPDVERVIAWLYNGSLRVAEEAGAAMFHPKTVTTYPWAVLARARGIALCLLGCVVLAACDARGEQSAIPTAVIELTSTSIAVSPTVGSKDAASTRIAENYNRLRTEVALTHAPTWTIGVPPEYPSATPHLGLSNECTSTNSRAPQFANCWIGVVNGEIFYVSAGREGFTGLGGPDDDPPWGIIEVSIRDRRGSTQLFRTPWKVGEVRIVEINNTLFTLAPIDRATPYSWLTPWATTTPGVTFVFDLATRQWVSVPPSPTVTVTPVLSLIPTTSPLPTP
jgi:hypothetical protein